jgi:uncharacterized protein (TIGR03086 family)
MEPQDFYISCLEQAGGVVRQVRADQLVNETPDDEWTVRDLANHMLYEVSWVPDIVAGRTIAEVGSKYDGDLFDADVANSQTNLIAAWDAAAQKAELAVADCDMDDTAHLSYTDTTNADYLQQTGGDILVHAWDLAKAIGVPFRFDETAAEIMWRGVKDTDMSGSGLFKPPLPAADNASFQEKILAHLGRDIRWRPAA